MKKYLISITDSNGTTNSFESYSRNSKALLKEHGGNICRVFAKDGEEISEARYTPEEGGKIYNCYIEK